MKPRLLIIFYLVSALVIGSACNETTDKKAETGSASSDSFTVTKSDTITKDSDSHNNKPRTDTLNSAWLEDFKSFRNALYQKNKEVVKTYFDFPVTDAGELWYYVLMDKDPYGRDSALTKKPFTESDFYKYYDKLFPKAFVSTLMKVKSKEVAEQKGTDTETPSITIDKVIYKMYASVDKTDASLRLSLNSWTSVNREELGEFSAAYIFRILPNGRLKFHTVMLAG